MFLNPEFQFSMINGSRVLEKGCDSTFELFTPDPSELQKDLSSNQSFLNPEFQFSMTNGPGVIEKGRGSTFEEIHALLICKTINKISRAL